MNAYQFIEKYGLKKAKDVISNAPYWAHYYSTVDDEYYLIEIKAVNILKLKQAIADFELISNIGGIKLARKIIQFKSQEKPKATHFAQDPSKKYVQLYYRHQPKLKNAIFFGHLEKAIERIEMGLQA